MSEARHASVDLTGAEGWLAEVRRCEQAGECFKAYDLARQGLLAHPGDRWLAQRAVLALCNAGALSLARRRFEEFGLSRFDETEFIALDARILKSEALQSDAAQAPSQLRRAADRYEVAWRRAIAAEAADAYYPGINVATLSLLAGDVTRATAIAGEVLTQIEPRLDAQADSADEDNYWLIATAIEAWLIQGDTERAREWFASALRANAGRHAQLATTAQQLRRILRARQLDPELLADIASPECIHYTGQMMASAERVRGIAEAAEAEVAADIARTLDGLRIGSAFGSLAAGADILFVESLLERGVRVHVVLPFALDDFVAQSVAPFGASWVQRFRACLARATSVRYATDDGYLGDDHLFAYCSRLAMGLTVLAARHLDAVARQVALWDGVATENVAGTAADIVLWQEADLPGTLIRIAAPEASGLARPRLARDDLDGRITRAMLFGDFKGFSKLSDAQIPAFSRNVLPVLAQVIDGFTSSLACVNTWGDGLFLVFDDVAEAARGALALQAAMATIDLAAAGLPATLALRIGGHFGPIFAIDDPLLHRRNFLGAHVTRAARIEPVTPEGCVYVTETFAAVLALERANAFACDYVGMTDAAKSFGAMRMFLLRPVQRPDETPSVLRQIC